MHLRLFIHALRSALLFVAGFFIYEVTLKLEYKWNSLHPEHKLYNFHKKEGVKFVFIFMIDLILLYCLALLFNYD